MLLAGLATALSPCLFPIMPAYLAAVARRSGGWARTVSAFSLSLAAGLTAYAALAALAGRGAVALIPMSPQDAAALLSAIMIALSAVQVTPGGRLGALIPKPKRGRLDVAGAATAGLSFALLAAPCASGPLLALAAVAALEPGIALAGALAFAAGAAAPFALAGAAAGKLSRRLRGAGRWSGVASAAILAGAGAAGLLSTGDPVASAVRILPLARAAATAAWVAALLAASAKGVKPAILAACFEVAAVAAPQLAAAASAAEAAAAAYLLLRGRRWGAAALAACAARRLPAQPAIELVLLAASTGLAPTIAAEAILP